MKIYVKGKEIELDTSKKPFGKGSEGVLYEKEGILYKIYYPEQLNEGYGQKEKHHNYLLSIPTKQVVLPLEAIYDERGEYIGYTTKKLVDKPNERTGIIKMPKEKFIKNLLILEEDVALLADRYVLQADVTPFNYIFNSSDSTMNIIDPGRYRHHTKELKWMYYFQNNQQLKELIMILLLLDFYEYKPIGSKRKSQLLRDLIKEKFINFRGQNLSEFFEEELDKYESVYEYSKTLGKYIK